MKAREMERIRSKFPGWSFENIQLTLDRLAKVICRSNKDSRRTAAYEQALRWYSREAIGVACRKDGGPLWHGLCGDCSALLKSGESSVNRSGAKVCTTCSERYTECGHCHALSVRGLLRKIPDCLEGAGELWCVSCFDERFNKCRRCDKVHLKSVSVVLADGTCRCPGCATSVHECSDCHTLHDARSGGITTITVQGDTGPWVCSPCLRAHWRQCHGCTTGGHSVYHRHGTDCPEGHIEEVGRDCSHIAREGNFRFFQYHGNPFKDSVKTYMNEPAHGARKVTMFGLEMEVEGDFKAQARALTAAGLNERDLYAERDSTVDVEWVTRPMDIETLVPFLRKVSNALRPVAKAYDSRKTCGCHHNVDRHALDEDGWGKVCIAVSKYFKELRKFSGKHRSEGNFPIDPHEGKTPRKMHEVCKSKGKYSAAAFHKSRVVELRIAGMTLNEASLVTQSKLYANLVRNAGEKGFDPRGDFQTVFGPLDDEMLNVCYRKEIIPCPPGMEVPEDPERPGRKRRTACALPEGRVLASQWDFIVDDVLEVIHPDEMDDRFGNCSVLDWASAMDAFVGQKFRVVAKVRGTDSPERKVVRVELISSDKTKVDRASGYAWRAGMFHLAEAAAPRDPSLRDRYELRVGDAVVLLPEQLPPPMRYLGGAIAEVRFVDEDTVGDAKCAIRIKLLTRVVSPEGVDHLRTSWKYTADMFRLALPEERASVQEHVAFIPEGRASRYDFHVGDILKFRDRSEARDDLEEAFFEIDFPATLDAFAGSRVRVLEEPVAMSSPLYQDQPYNRVLKIEVVDKAAEYAALIASRTKYPGEDYRFFSGMFEFVRPDAASVPPPPASPYFFRKGDVLEFRGISDTPNAEALGYLPHMAYLQGMAVVMVSPGAVASPESTAVVKLLDPVNQAEHESQLSAYGREAEDWLYRAGMFRKPELEMPVGSTKETLAAVEPSRGKSKGARRPAASPADAPVRR